MKNLFLLVFAILFFASANYAQKIYKVKYESQADIKVYVVNYESQADLKVYKVDYESQANKDGLWYFLKYESQADLKIYFVDYESQAGWVNKSKQHLLY